MCDEKGMFKVLYEYRLTKGDFIEAGTDMGPNSLSVLLLLLLSGIQPVVLRGYN
jgi:hypothetical protein